MDRSVSEVSRLVDSLTEQNPMLGHRGCRLGVTYPEIYEMQARAIMEAAVAVTERGRHARPEIMIPLVGIGAELTRLRERVEAVVGEVREEAGVDLECHVGTMIELPRAALRAGEIARSADFFSFGTNDLTQTTYGISRDDAGGFLDAYQTEGIVEEDPFAVLDREGVGELIRIAVERGREARPGLQVGICGEHGGEPSSVAFCHEAGLDYVSCSPYRVPVARIAAAQAAVETADDVSTY
jgi:pyruvate,orthophosphate dikinase